MNQFRSVRMQELSWAQIEPLANDATVVILPTGAIEQHGRHLPLEVDARAAEEIAVRAARDLLGSLPVLVAPTLSYGVSGYHMAFPGTLTLSMSTFTTMVDEVTTSLVHHGFRRILILNGHGGNHDPVKIAARNVADQTGVAVAAASYWNIAADELARFEDSEIHTVPGHACGFETSCMLALKPDLVDDEELRYTSEVQTGAPGGSGRPGFFTKRLTTREPKVQLPPQAGIKRDFGNVGDPGFASREKGEKYLGVINEKLVEFLRIFAGRAPESVTGAFLHERVNRASR